MPAGQGAQDVRGRGGPFLGDGFLDGAGGGPGDPFAGEPGRRVRRCGAQPGAGRLVAGGHAVSPGRQPARSRQCVRRGTGRQDGRDIRRRGPVHADATGQLAGVVGSVAGFLGQQVQDDAFQVLGHFAAVFAQRPGRGVAMADEDRPGVVEVERRYAGGDLVEHAPERVQVAALVDLGAADLLRGHVVRGAHGDAGAGQPGGEADVVAEAGYAEVADLHRAVAEAHDVGGFQVAVDDVLLVAVREGRGDLLGDLHDVRDRQRVLLVVLQELAEIAAVQQFHDEVEDAVRLAEVVHDGDAPVLERGGHPGLTPEPLPQHAGEGVVVVGAQRFEALDGDVPAQGLVPCPPHLPHAAAPDQIEQPVSAVDEPGLPHVARRSPR